MPIRIDWIFHVTLNNISVYISPWQSVLSVKETFLFGEHNEHESNSKSLKGPSGSWSYGSWIYNNLYATTAYHHCCCEFEFQSGRGVQHYVIKFVSVVRQVGVFSGSSCFLHQLKWPSRYNWNSVESGVKHHHATQLLMAIGLG